MNRFQRRLVNIESKKTEQNRPVVVPFPIDGLSDKEIEDGLKRWNEQGEMTPEEWETEHYDKAIFELTTY